MSLRISIPVVAGLVLLAVVGVVQAAAKDHPTTAEGIVFWLSLLALPLLLVSLVALVVVAIRRGVKRHARADVPS